MHFLDTRFFDSIFDMCIIIITLCYKISKQVYFCIKLKNLLFIISVFVVSCPFAFYIISASLPSPAWMQVALYSWRSDCHSMGTRPAGPGTG